MASGTEKSELMGGFTESQFADMLRSSPTGSVASDASGGGQERSSRRGSAIFDEYSQWEKSASATNKTKVLMERMLERLIGLLDDSGDGRVPRRVFLEALAKGGLLPDDPRLVEMFKLLADMEGRVAAAAAVDAGDDDGDPTSNGFLIADLAKVAVAGGQIIINILSSHVAIPDFAWFCDELRDIFDEVAQDDRGHVADAIPQLADQDPSLFGVSVCTVDGQRFSLGDSGETFCLQSCTNPFTYGMALEENGIQKVHEHVGREPSGRTFNDFVLKPIPSIERVKPEREAIPHNPMISAGAILCSSMIKPELPVAARLSHYEKVWSELCGGKKPNCAANVMLSERENADRIKTLGFMMKESNTFADDDIDLASVLELYFSTCATSMTTDMLAVAGATLANAGTNPLTVKRVFSEETVQSILALMLSCGMNSESGKWAFDVGVPAKSGMAGGLLLVIPKVCGIAIFSPNIQEHSNSVRGVSFAKKLVDIFSFHHLDSQLRSQKFDATQAHSESQSTQVVCEMLAAAAAGDLGTLKLLMSRGFSPNCCDYDHRTPLHIAASEGRSGAVQFLLLSGANCFARDRLGKTALESCEEMVIAATPNDGGEGGDRERKFSTGQSLGDARDFNSSISFLQAAHAKQLDGGTPHRTAREFHGRANRSGSLAGLRSSKPSAMNLDSLEGAATAAAAEGGAVNFTTPRRARQRSRSTPSTPATAMD